MRFMMSTTFCEVNYSMRQQVKKPPTFAAIAQRKSYLTESVYKLVFQKSIHTQIRQLILHVSNKNGQFDGFVQELTFAQRIHQHFL